MSIFLFIDDVDETISLRPNSVNIKNQLQQRSDSMSFIFNDGATVPGENLDITFFRGDTIAGFAGVTVTLDGNFQKETKFFFPGQKLKIRVNDSDEEEVIVDTYDEDALQIVLVAAPSGSVSVGDKIGPKMFGGVISRVKTKDVKNAANVEFDIQAVDFTKIFDKKLVSDTFAEVDSRYIINSFVNTTVNLNQTIDDFDFDNDTAIQAAWTEAGDGNNPTIDSADFIEGDASGVFAWTNSGGTANWTSTPTAVDIENLVGASSGTPTAGALMIWIKPDDFTLITSIKARIGSSASDFVEVDFGAPVANKFKYFKQNLAGITPTGTPDWTAVDYAEIIVEQTGSGQVILGGLRVNADKSFTLFNVEETPTFDDFRAPLISPTSLMQTLAQTWEYIWFIDYDRDIHFSPMETTAAPFDIDSNAEYSKLVTNVDQSQLGNRITVIGGEQTSQNRYAQTFAGDASKREWLTKNKFSDMIVSVNDGSDSNTAEAGTNTTNIKITAHGLLTNDHIVNVTRGDIVRQIVKVDDDNFTVEAVTGQTTGDNITFFSTTKTVGIEGIDDETLFDYMQNSNEKSIRATDSEDTLGVGEFIRMDYLERIPVQFQYTDSASQTALAALGIGDGLFDLAPIKDQNIQDLGTAIAIAQAKTSIYSNAIVNGSYRTEWNGIAAGQIQRVNDPNRGFDEENVIQTVSIKQSDGAFNDNFLYSVSFGTTLFGWIEFMQKLLAVQDKIEINTDATVVIFITADEVVESSDVNQVATDGGFLSAKNTETVESSDVNKVDVLATGTWRFEPNGVGQPFESRFDLCDFG